MFRRCVSDLFLRATKGPPPHKAAIWYAGNGPPPPALSSQGRRGSGFLGNALTSPPTARVGLVRTDAKERLANTRCIERYALRIVLVGGLVPRRAQRVGVFQFAFASPRERRRTAGNHERIEARACREDTLCPPFDRAGGVIDELLH